MSVGGAAATRLKWEGEEEHGKYKLEKKGGKEEHGINLLNFQQIWPRLRQLVRK